MPKQFTHRVVETTFGGGTSLKSDYTLTATGENSESFDEDVPDATVDQEYAFTVDISELQAIVIKSDQDLTIKTNSSSTPQETLNMSAGKPKRQFPGEPALFSGDVTSIFVSNASGAQAKLQIETLENLQV